MNPTTTMRILFFSVLKDVTGVAELDWEINADESLTVASLLGKLRERFPGLSEWQDRLLVAVDLVYAKPDQPICAGQEVALMPPVQGG